MNYFLDTNPGGEFILGLPLLIFFVVAIFAKSFFKTKISADKYFKKSCRRRFWRITVFGVLGVILVAARFSEVPFFSMRLFLYLIFGSTILVALFTFFQIFRDYKKRLNSVRREKCKK